MKHQISLADALKEWRISQKMSWQKLSDTTGVPRTTYFRYEERKGTMPNTSTLLRFADFLNLSIEEVINMAEYDLQLREKNKGEDNGKN